jgi:hypothetical protein
MKLSLLHELSTNPTTIGDITQDSTQLSLLQEMERGAIQSKPNNFIGIDPFSTEHVALEDQLGIIKRSNPDLYRKIVNLV